MGSGSPTMCLIQTLAFHLYLRKLGPAQVHALSQQQTQNWKLEPKSHEPEMGPHGAHPGRSMGDTESKESCIQLSEAASLYLGNERRVCLQSTSS